MKCFKICVIGAPSTRKTTLCLKVVSQLKEKCIDAAFVGEYARNWMAKHERYVENPADQFAIFSRQKRREDEYCKSQEVIVTDNSSWLGAVYATYAIRKSHYKSDLIHVLDLIEDTLLLNEYDLQYYVPFGLYPIKIEPGRIQKTNEEAELVDRKIKGFIDLFDIPIKELPKENDSIWTDIIVKDIEQLLNGIK